MKSHVSWLKQITVLALAPCVVMGTVKANRKIKKLRFRHKAALTAVPPPDTDQSAINHKSNIKAYNSYQTL